MKFASVILQNNWDKEMLIGIGVPKHSVFVVIPFVEHASLCSDV